MFATEQIKNVKIFQSYNMPIAKVFYL